MPRVGRKFIGIVKISRQIMACILLLEDDEVTARLAIRMLSKQGHHVLHEVHTEEAWLRLEEAPIDLLILDSQLDGENGWDFLARIRGDILFKELPVIIYTSTVQRDVIQRYLKLGVQGILVKPAAAERMNQETERVTRVPWRKSLFEPEQDVEKRAGLAAGDVTRLYREAAKELSDAIEEVGVLAEDPANASAISRVSALKSCALNIGYTRLKQVMDAITSALEAKDGERIRAMTERLPAALQLLIMQAGDEIELDESGAEKETPDSVTESNAEAAPDAEPAKT